MKTLNISTLAIAILIGFSSCQKDNDPVTPTSGYTIPSTYSFVDVTGKSTVAIEGQFVRISLLKNLITEIAKAESETVLEQTLLDIYQKNNEDQGVYTSLATGKSLKSTTLASGQNDAIQQAAKDTVERWLGQVAALSGTSGTFIRADGVDLKQAVEKFLMGAILYDQAVNKYLYLTPSKSNTDFTSGKGTSMEHYFDEAFGYFGASRYFNNLSNTAIINGGEDIDGISGLDPLTEGCFYYATTAAKRENAAVTGKMYTDLIFTNFAAGRAAITNNDIITRGLAISNIEKYWEEIIAATVVHYINELILDLDINGNVVLPNADLSKHWAEMYYYFEMLQFDQNTILTTSEKDAIATLMGNDNGYASPGNVTKTDLEAARDYFRAYFTSSQLTQW